MEVAVWQFRGSQIARTGIKHCITDSSNGDNSQIFKAKIHTVQQYKHVLDYTSSYKTIQSINTLISDAIKGVITTKNEQFLAYRV